MITIKLPQPFVDAYGSQIRAVDWPASPKVELQLRKALPPLAAVTNEPSSITVTLEAISRGPATIIRAASMKDAIRIRQHSDEIAARDPDRYPPASPDEVAEVLSRRNPTTPV